MINKLSETQMFRKTGSAKFEEEIIHNLCCNDKR